MTAGLIAKGDEVHFGDDEDVLELAMLHNFEQTKIRWIVRFEWEDGRVM